MRTLALAAVVAVAGLALNGAPAGAVPAPKVLGPGDSGKTVVLVRGQRLRIELRECPSCGYRWKTTRAPSRRILRRLRQRHSGGCSPKPCIGGSSVTMFRYAARARGITRLRLGYFPPAASRPESIFELRVRVR